MSCGNVSFINTTLRCASQNPFDGYDKIGLHNLNLHLNILRHIMGMDISANNFKEANKTSGIAAQRLPEWLSTPTFTKTAI